MLNKAILDGTKMPNYVDVDYGEEIDLNKILGEIISHYKNKSPHLEGKCVSKNTIGLKAKALRSIIYCPFYAGYPKYELQSLVIDNHAIEDLAKEKHFLRFRVGSLKFVETQKVRDDVFGDGRASIRYIDHECDISGNIIVEQYRWKFIDRLFGHHV